MQAYAKVPELRLGTSPPPFGYALASTGRTDKNVEKTRKISTDHVLYLRLLAG